MDAEYLSPDEFSQLSGLSIATVRRYLRAGRLPHVQPAGSHGRILIPRDALDRLADPPPRDLPPSTPTSPSMAAPPNRPRGPRPRWQSSNPKS